MGGNKHGTPQKMKVGSDVFYLKWCIFRHFLRVAFRFFVFRLGEALWLVRNLST
jgi:hypothetical protein